MAAIQHIPPAAVVHLSAVKYHQQRERDRCVLANSRSQWAEDLMLLPYLLRAADWGVGSFVELGALDGVTATPVQYKDFSHASAAERQELRTRGGAETANKQGWLDKQKDKLKGWSKRYFVLSQHQLAYYREEPGLDTEARAVFDLTHFSIEAGDPAKMSFVVRSATDNVVLRADDLVDMTGWIKEVAKGIDIGKMAAFAWRGPDFINDPTVDTAGCGWILAENWWPYQRPSFVTPNFAGYVSGHSTYSRAAAELLTLLTGSPYFPGGVGEYVADRNQFLVFEKGPSTTVTLQWVSYRDASDQCSLSRIWGGIHPIADDLPGRLMGLVIGPQAYELATQHFDGFDGCLGDLTGDNEVNFSDLQVVLSAWGLSDGGDLNDDGETGFSDLQIVLSSWGNDC